MLTTLLRILGIAAWAACLLVLGYQALMWVFTASWPSITLLDALNNLFGVDILTLIGNLPFEYAAKAVYLLVTTTLSLALWWIGVAFFGFTIIKKVATGR